VRARGGDRAHASTGRATDRTGRWPCSSEPSGGRRRAAECCKRGCGTTKRDPRGRDPLLWLHRSTHSRCSVPTTRSAIAFAFGARTGVSTVLMPMPCALSTKSPPQERSRSRIKKRGLVPPSRARPTGRCVPASGCAISRHSSGARRR
jgi:hypothetical protein